MDWENHDDPARAQSVSGCLVKLMADSLRDLRRHNRLMVHLPQLLGASDWSGWMDNADPTPVHGGHGLIRRFGVVYSFHTDERWDRSYVLDRFTVLWQMWGWTVTEGQGPMGSRELLGESGDGTVFEFDAADEARNSYLRVTSRRFAIDGKSSGEVMPFAVTPFGPLNLAQVWLVLPQLVVW